MIHVKLNETIQKIEETSDKKTKKKQRTPSFLLEEDTYYETHLYRLYMA